MMTVTPYSRVDAIDDMQRCIRLLRLHSEELGITQRVAVMGFSAGGMLSANCATVYDCDDPRNAFATGYALTMAGVPFELHCFPEGVHGLALADGANDLSMDIPHVAHWAQLCAEWLTEQDI